MRRASQTLGLIFALIPAPASAQRPRLLPALETFVAAADRAFTGHVVKLERTDFRNAPGGPNHRPFLPADYPLFRYTLTVRVEKNIRGDGADTVALQFEVQSDTPYYREWIKGEKSFLWSVGPADPARWGILADRTRQNTPERGSLRWFVLDLAVVNNHDHSSHGRFQLPLFAENLQVVRTRKEALARLEAFARSHPKPLPLFDAVLSDDFVRRNGIDPNAGLRVAFPNDPVANAAIRLHRKRQGGAIDQAGPIFKTLPGARP